MSARLRHAALLVVLAALLAPASVGAADSVYWTDSGSGAIRFGNLDGSGTASDLFTGEDSPRGVAIDPAANRIYWADTASGAIRVGNLDGTGSASNLFVGEDLPQGVAIDPGANRIYWADNDSGAIRVGNLDGSGTASDLFMGESAPTGVAIDPGANRIYWTNLTIGSAIRFGNLDGSGMPSSLFTNSMARGVAIDPAANRIYWTHSVADGVIRTMNLPGPGEVSDLFVEQSAPAGVAIDPAESRIYWANLGSGEIRTGNLVGTRMPSNLFEGESSPAFPALLRSPAGAGGPRISGGGEVGQPLSCSQGGWATDLLGAFLFRAPRSFAYRWGRDGIDVGGATQPTHTPTEPGSYACRVIASNQAGSSSQTSTAVQVSGLKPPPDTEVTLRIKGKKLRFNKKRIARARLTCPASEASPPCTGRLKLKTQKKVRFKGKKGRATLARSKRFAIGAGETRRVTLRLAKPKRRLVRRAKRARRVQAIVRVRDAAGNRATVRKRMRVRAR